MKGVGRARGRANTGRNDGALEATQIEHDEVLILEVASKIGGTPATSEWLGEGTLRVVAGDKSWETCGPASERDITRRFLLLVLLDESRSAKALAP